MLYTLPGYQGGDGRRRGYHKQPRQNLHALRLDHQRPPKLRASAQKSQNSGDRPPMLMPVASMRVAISMQTMAAMAGAGPGWAAGGGRALEGVGVKSGRGLSVLVVFADGHAGLYQRRPQQPERHECALQAGVADLDPQHLKYVITLEPGKLFERLAGYLFSQHGCRRLADGAASPTEPHVFNYAV